MSGNYAYERVAMSGSTIPQGESVLLTLLKLPELEVIEILAQLEQFRPVILQRALAVSPYALTPACSERSVASNVPWKSFDDPEPKLTASCSSARVISKIRTNMQEIELLQNRSYPSGEPKKVVAPEPKRAQRQPLLDIPEPKLQFLPMQVAEVKEISRSSAFTPGGSSRRETSAFLEEPIVQFTAFVYFCNEDEGQMNIDIMRAGNLSKPSEVSFRTVDASAKAKTTYEAVDTRLRFAREQDCVSVAVPLICSDDWDTTTELVVELYAGEGLVNATLGRFLWTARVKIIDNDCFPSNKHEEFIRDGVCVEDAPNLSLFIEYVKLNWSNPVVRERSKKIMAIDQLHNLYNFFHLFVNVYLVDYVLNPNSPIWKMVFTHSKRNTLLAIVATMLLPYFFLHALDHRKAEKYGVGGTSRQRLQVCLLRKFLNYDTVSRFKLSSGDLIMAMTRDSSLLASEGYSNVLQIVKETGSLFFMLAYQFIAPVVFGRRFNWLAFMPLPLFPVAMYCFLEFRSAITDRWLDEQNNCQNILASSVDETVDNYQLMSDYNQRERCIKRFDVEIKNFNDAHRNSGIILKNNAYFAKWLSLICIAFWTFVGGTMVLDGEMSLGMFLTNVNILGMIGSAWGEIYKVSMDIMTIFPSLENVVRAMNLPTDVSVRKTLNNLSRRESAMLVKMLRKDEKSGEKRLAIDRMFIKVGNIPFSYRTESLGGVQRTTSLNISGMARIRQGELAFFMGPRGGGKGSLLKIIGGEILPRPEDVSGSFDGNREGGRCFVPSHLRVLHVSAPIFFDDTLLSNLVFGVPDGNDDGRPERVASVCRLLGVEDDVLDHLYQGDSLQWSDVFSTTQCQLLSVARALVANPEILCIHQPTQLFNEAVSKQIMAVLKSYVNLRGVVQDAQGRRRPRTLVMTTAQKSSLDVADRVFHISKERGIEEVQASDYIAMEEMEASASFASATSGPGLQGIKDSTYDEISQSFSLR